MAKPGLVPQLFEGYCQKTPPQPMPPDAGGAYVTEWQLPVALVLARMPLQSVLSPVLAGTIAIVPAVAPSPMKPLDTNTVSTTNGSAPPVVVIAMSSGPCVPPPPPPPPVPVPVAMSLTAGDGIDGAAVGEHAATPRPAAATHAHRATLLQS